MICRENLVTYYGLNVICCNLLNIFAAFCSRNFEVIKRVLKFYQTWDDFLPSFDVIRVKVINDEKTIKVKSFPQTPWVKSLVLCTIWCSSFFSITFGAIDLDNSYKRCNANWQGTNIGGYVSSMWGFTVQSFPISNFTLFRMLYSGLFFVNRTIFTYKNIHKNHHSLHG